MQGDQFPKQLLKLASGSSLSYCFRSLIPSGLTMRLALTFTEKTNTGISKIKQCIFCVKSVCHVHGKTQENWLHSLDYMLALPKQTLNQFSDSSLQFKLFYSSGYLQTGDHQSVSIHHHCDKKKKRKNHWSVKNATNKGN